MAWKVFNTTGNWSSGAETVTNTPTLHASTNITISSGGINSATFTAPNAINKSTGVLVYLTARGTAGSLVATLLENGVATAATQTIAFADIPNPAGTVSTGVWVYFRWPAAYTFTTTTAGAYRIKLNTSGASGTFSAAADSGAANFAFLNTDDRVAVPSTEETFVVGQNGLNSPQTITVTGTTSTCGSGAEVTGTNTTQSPRTLLSGLQIGAGGTLNWDSTASATLSVKGNINIKQGTLSIGTVATPIPSAYIGKLVMTAGAASGDFAIWIENTGQFILQGSPVPDTTNWRAHYSSGDGTTATPLTVPSGWSVGDEIYVTASSSNSTNYNESERKFIKTKPTATTATLADTAGGVESGLSFTHTTDAWLLNIQRNVIITSSDTTKGWAGMAISTTAGDVNMDWARLEYTGNNSGLAGNKEAFRLMTTSASTTSSMDYTVIYGHIGHGVLMSTSSVDQTFTGNIFCKSAATVSSTAGISLASVKNKTFQSCYFVDQQNDGLLQNGSLSCELIDCYAISCNKRGSVSAQAGFVFNSGDSLTLTSCEAHANRNINILFAGGTTNNSLHNCLVGTKGTTATADLYIATGVSTTATFFNSSFGSSTLFANYLNALDGTEVRFHNYQNVTNSHTWYTNYGSACSTGAGLSDTTVRTPGSLGVRLAPEESSTGFTWSFLIPAKAMSTVTFYGYFRKNAAFGTDVATIELWLPGSTAADSTATLTNTTGSWLAALVFVQNSNSVDGLAEIRINAKSATPGAYLYIDDFYSAGDTVTNSDKVTGLDTWYQGKPIQIVSPQIPLAADIVTTLLNTTLTTYSSGTVGKQIKDLLTTSKFLGLK